MNVTHLMMAGLKLWQQGYCSKRVMVKQMIGMAQDLLLIVHLLLWNCWNICKLKTVFLENIKKVSPWSYLHQI